MKSLQICRLHCANKSVRLVAIIALMLMSSMGYSQAHVTMSLKNIKATSNTIEYDLYIVNDGHTALKLSAGSYGVNYNNDILNGGNLSYTCHEGSRANELNNLSSFSLATTTVNDVNQLRMTSTSVRRSYAPELILNVPLKIGRFRIANSHNWAPNSLPGFELLESKIVGMTTTQVIVYIDNEVQLTALTPSLKTVSTQVETSPVLNPDQWPTDNTINNSSIDQMNLFTDEANVNVLENMTSGELGITVNINENTRTVFRVFDLSGRLIMTVQADLVKNMNKVTLDINALPGGIYLLKVSDGKTIHHSQTFTKR